MSYSRFDGSVLTHIRIILNFQIQFPFLHSKPSGAFNFGIGKLCGKFIANVTDDICLSWGRNIVFNAEVSRNYNSYDLLVNNYNMNGYLPQIYSLA